MLTPNPAQTLLWIVCLLSCFATISCSDEAFAYVQRETINFKGTEPKLAAFKLQFPNLHLLQAAADFALRSEWEGVKVRLFRKAEPNVPVQSLRVNLAGNAGLLPDKGVPAPYTGVFSYV
eukprot:scaffold748_cov329-Pavlova_lutheri.AAC.6